MDALVAEYPEYAALEIEKIDEILNPKIAEAYDYYYVPSYFINGIKLHEGAASPEIIKNVFDVALSE